ncbi:STE family protein kinase [Trichomonas vaginalis G3]|uniref:STE family protein kinase n=1 Tax=Trichomonas vaginalis (strain ATCC PRA-98 / G3) TaxID=412133 RepID=A2FZ69_TRIV3|nr:protein kinase protein [Trichomonas vaginalis G3]EAX89803.1 STE family protein kinase [Trichomonas vaginalis G3]KAI5538366.1 protein kinase protein [Trichomonas vaginalis G3]|eukprot:XP_001302733.1 STE family protein kinase [Trichomonas vaginalis G3]
MELCDAEFFLENGFDYVSTIGRGTYGLIYQVYDHQYSQNFALKRVLETDFNENEVKCMIEIRSNNIVPLYKYYRFKQFVYLLMEYCPLNIERSIVHSSKINLDKQYDIALGISEAVYSCHKYCIAHGDIKPSNFLLDKYGRIKICDFGLSKKTSPEQNCTTYNGTLLYAAPEVISCQPYDAFAADIWAMGVTIFYVFTGKHPFPDNDRQTMIHLIMNSIYDDSHISDVFIKQIIQRCLQVDPSLRPSAEVVAKTIRSQIKNSSRKKFIRQAASAKTSASLVLNSKLKRMASSKRISSM